MKLLDPVDYNKVVKPLLEVPINTLYARAVVEKKYVKGWVYVDNPENPHSFYIIHPCGMSLSFGVPQSRYHDEYRSNEWMLSYPNLDDPGNFFSETYTKLFNYTRIHFKFNKEKYNYKKNEDLNIIRTDRDIYNTLKGPIHPKYYWDNIDDFLNIGLGFSLIHEGQAVATAFTTSIIDNIVDIGVVTLPQYWGRGFGVEVANAMVEFLVAAECKPRWGTFSYNLQGIRVAEKLGFEIEETLPCHGLLYLPLTSR